MRTHLSRFILNLTLAVALLVSFVCERAFGAGPVNPGAQPEVPEFDSGVAPEMEPGANQPSGIAPTRPADPKRNYIKKEAPTKREVPTRQAPTQRQTPLSK